MKNYILMTFIFLGFSALSQVIVKPLLIQAGGGNCDNTVVISGLNLPANAYIARRTNQYTETEVHVGDTITDYCDYTISPNFSDEIVVSFWSGVDTLHNTMILPQYDFFLENYISPSSSASSDGELTFYFINGVDPNDFTANSFYGQPYTIHPIDSQRFKVTGIEEGVLVLEYSNSVTGDFFRTSVLIDQLYGSAINDQLTVSHTTQNAQNTCNGSVLFNASGTGPYTYEWANNAMTSTFTDTLCPGVYTVLVTDQATMNNSVEQFLIVDTADIYLDGSVELMVPLDSANFLYEYCGLDYSQPIDSISYSETYISGPVDSSTFVINLIMYQNNSAYILQDSVVLNNGIAYSFSFGIYCNYFKSTAFAGKEIQMIRGAFGTQLSVDDLSTNTQLSIYPNPTKDLLHINGSQEGGSILSSDGRIVKTFNGDEVNISALKAGVYYFQAKNNSTVIRFVKD